MLKKERDIALTASNREEVGKSIDTSHHDFSTILVVHFHFIELS